MPTPRLASAVRWPIRFLVPPAVFLLFLLPFFPACCRPIRTLLSRPKTGRLGTPDGNSFLPRDDNHVTRRRETHIKQNDQRGFKRIGSSLGSMTAAQVGAMAAGQKDATGPTMLFAQVGSGGLGETGGSGDDDGPISKEETEKVGGRLQQVGLTALCCRITLCSWTAFLRVWKEELQCKRCVCFGEIAPNTNVCVHVYARLR